VIITGGIFKGYKVNCGIRGNLGLKGDILEAILFRFRIMTECHPYVLILRYDLRFPQHVHFPDLKLALQKFTNHFSIFLNRRNISYHYVWVKEINHSENPHYHCVFFVSTGRYDSPYALNHEAQSIWSRICSDSFYHAPKSLLHYCPRKFQDGIVQDSVLLSRDDPHFEFNFRECFYWLSYLAKVNSKILNPGRGDRWWGASQLRLAS
jgi:hypothetical protein